MKKLFGLGLVAVIGAAIALADIEPSTVTFEVSTSGPLLPTDKAAMENQVAEALQNPPFSTNEQMAASLTYTNNVTLKNAFERVMSNRVAVAWNSYRLTSVSAEAARGVLTEELMREVRQNLIARIKAGVSGSNLVSAIKQAR